MKKIIKIIFLSLLIQSIYCQRKCLINDDDECEAENDETYICKGNYQDGCEAIPRCKYHSSNENNCALYPVSKDKAGKCISVGGDKCEEQLYCDYMTNLLDDSACRDQPVNPEFNGIKICVLKSGNEGGCESKLLCENVPTTENDPCSSFPTRNKETKICLANQSGNSKCREEFYCGKEEFQNSDENCKNSIVSDSENKICVFESDKCKEKLLCTKASGEQVSDSNCPSYTPSREKRATYSCIKNPINDECIEQLLCQHATGQNINCGDYPVTEANKNTHACISNTGGSSICKEETLCSKTNTGTLTLEECRLHPISVIDNKDDYLCVPKSGGGCEEKLKCTKVQDKGNNDCSYFPTTDQSDKVCVDNTGGNTACKEQFFCSKATSGNTNEECMDYAVTDHTKYICQKNDIPGGSPCKEVQLCDTITGDTLTDSECLKYPVSKGNQKTHTCIKDPKNNKCMEQYFCTSAPESEGLNCTNYIISKDNQTTHYCVNDPINNKCKEQYICDLVSNYTKEEVNCSDYPVIYEHANTHLCVYDFDKNRCKENFLCESVPNNTINVDCSNYPVVLNNTETHVCISNTEGSTLCKEIEICPVVKNENLTQEECRLHPISERENKNDYLCVVNINNTGCEEQLKCEAVKNLGYNECSDFPTVNERKVCIEKRGKNTICKEEFICLKANQSESNEECMNYVVTNDTKYICLKNDDGNSSCKEVELCETIIGENLTDSECIKHPVSKGNQKTHTCVKDPYKNKCMEQFFCNSVPKYICSNYPVQIGNEDTHHCSENPNGDTPCIEIKNEITTSSELVDETDELNMTTFEIDEIQNSTLVINNETEVCVSNSITTEKGNAQTLIVLLGFSNFILKNKAFTFNTHFIPLTNPLYSEKLKFSSSIFYNNYYRQLEDSNFECTLTENDTQSSTDYFCNVQIQNKNIKQIKLLTNFIFTSQEQVSLVGITPIAKNSLNNIEKINNNEFNNLLSTNPPIFILDNCTINIYEDIKLKISGIIKNNKPKSLVANNNLTFMVNIENNDNEASSEIKCIIISVINYNYSLDCEMHYKYIYNLQSAVSIIDDGILMTNFYNYINENEKALVKNTQENIEYQFVKSSQGISVGVIIAIILGSLAVLAGIILTSIFIIKRNKKEPKNDSTSSQRQRFKILRID